MKASATGGAPSGRAELRFAVTEIDQAAVRRQLPVGATLSARVIAAHGENRFTVQFAGFKMIAESNLPLQAGEKMLVQVAAHEPRLHLKLLEAGPGGQGLDRLLDRIGFKSPTPELRELLAEMLDRGLPLDGDFLRRALAAMKRGADPRAAVRLAAGEAPLTSATVARARLANEPIAAALSRLTARLDEQGRGAEAKQLRVALVFSGDLEELFARHPLKQERRLLGPEPRAAADAKALLLELARDERNAPVSDAAEELLARLEGGYLFGEPEPAIRFVVEDDGFREASLAAQRQPGRAAVRFRLDTSRLGPVQGVIDCARKRAGLALGVKTPEARAALAAALPKLRESLAALGFTLESATVDVLTERSAAAAPAVGLDLRA